MNTSKQVKIGLVIVLTLLGTYWGINFLKGKDLFSKSNSYTIIYEKVDGLTLSSTVVLRGYKVGQVDKIFFSDSKQESITVEISVDNNINITEGTIAHIFSSDLMGTKSIDLLISESPIILKSKDTLEAKIEESISDQVKLQMLPLKLKTESLLGSVETAIESISNVFNKNTGNELRKSLEKVQSAIDAIQSSSVSLDTILTEGQSRISSILYNVDEISRNFAQNGDNFTNILTNFSQISDSLTKADIASTINNAEKSLSSLDSILIKINKGQGTMGQLFQDTSLYFNLNASTHSLNELLIDINENPGRYIHFSLINSSRKSKKE